MSLSGLGLYVLWPFQFDVDILVLSQLETVFSYSFLKVKKKYVYKYHRDDTMRMAVLKLEGFFLLLNLNVAQLLDLGIQEERF